MGNRIPDDNDFESLDKFSIVSLVIHNSITLNFSRYLSFYFLGNRLVIDVKFIFGMFWNLTAALSGNGPKVAKFLDR